jgi:hypothetical protein
MDQEREATVRVGDLLRIERRYTVNGELTTQTETGRFLGVELVGSAEHLVLRRTRGKAVRLFPLATVSEITVVKSATRVDAAASPPAPGAGPAPAPQWDPGFA